MNTKLPLPPLNVRENIRNETSEKLQYRHGRVDRGGQSRLHSAHLISHTFTIAVSCVFPHFLTPALRISLLLENVLTKIARSIAIFVMDG